MRTLDPQGGLHMRSHIGWRGERNIPYKCVETFPYHTRFKTVRLTTIHNKQKQTIFASDGLGLLQMVLKPNTAWCTSEDTGPSRGVDCEIPHRLEKGTK